MTSRHLGDVSLSNHINTVTGTLTLSSPKEILVLRCRSSNDRSIPEHILNARKVIHRSSQETRSAPKTTTNRRPSQTNHVRANMRERPTMVLPKPKRSRSHERPASVREQPVAEGRGVEREHVNHKGSIVSSYTVRSVGVSATLWRDLDATVNSTFQTCCDLSVGRWEDDA